MNRLFGVTGLVGQVEEEEEEDTGTWRCCYRGLRQIRKKKAQLRRLDDVVVRA